MTTLKAERRDMAVKAKKLRREGYVTGSVFGRELKESLPIRFSKKDADRLMKTSGKGSRIMLEVDGQQYNVLIKEIDFDALKRQINEIDFQALVQNEMVNSVAEILLLNHDKVQEGVLEQHLEEISYRALPASLVEKIEIDVEGMHVGDAIHVKDLAIAADKNVHLLTDPEEIVVSVAAVHNVDLGETETGEEAGEAAEAQS